MPNPEELMSGRANDFRNEETSPYPSAGRMYDDYIEAFKHRISDIGSIIKEINPPQWLHDNGGGPDLTHARELVDHIFSQELKVPWLDEIRAHAKKVTGD
ncbi:hypothetical protein FQN49_001670 [Arthroderma sp. PD_2]|nr:hypothetical protein FQN49_001670 [Arthroderma sp. PD_2]